MPEHEGAEPQLTEAAQKKAEELGVNPLDVQGTGQEGRVTVQDVERAAKVEGKGSGARTIGVDRELGSGEFVVPYGDGEEARFVAGVETPVGQEAYDALPKDENGDLAYPLVEIKKEDG